MARVSAKAAQRCLNGGIAAGILACKLDMLQKEAIYAEKASFSTTQTLVRESEQQARILRRSFGIAREDAKEIQETLKRWTKDLKKESKRGYMYVHKPTLSRDVSAMKKKLQKIIHSGTRVCGMLERVPHEFQSVLTDWAQYQKVVILEDVVVKEGERETVPARRVEAPAKAPATVGSRRR